MLGNDNNNNSVEKSKNDLNEYSIDVNKNRSFEEKHKYGIKNFD